MAKTMYSTLLELPLFQGLGADDVTRIIETAQLSFEVISHGRTLIHEGEMCNGLTFIISGAMVCTTPAADGTWYVEEDIDAPAMIGLDVLYGSQRTHRHTLTARQRSRVMFVTKPTVSALIQHYEVFRLNVLNTLTTQSVRTAAPLWLPAATSLEGRIIAFMHAHVMRPAGRKVFSISHATLGKYLGEDARYVSRALHTLAETGLISLERRAIEVASFENLLRHLRQRTS